jgi:integrase/recombinase XerD
MVELSMVRVTGPLAGHAEGFRADLIRRGYTSRTARDNVYVLAHLSRWLGAGHVGPSELTPLVVERFLRARRGAGYRRWLTTGSLRALLGYLREVGVAPVWQPPAAQDPVEELLDAYRGYLRVERRLAPNTVRINEEIARRFLSQRVAGRRSTSTVLSPRT